MLETSGVSPVAADAARIMDRPNWNNLKNKTGFVSIITLSCDLGLEVKDIIGDTQRGFENVEPCSKLPP